MLKSKLVVAITFVTVLLCVELMADASQIVVPISQGESISQGSFKFIDGDTVVAIASSDSNKSNRYSRIFRIEGSQIKEIARLDGMNINRIFSVAQNGNTISLLVGGGTVTTLTSSTGEETNGRVYTFKYLKVNVNGKINTLWDSTRLPINPGLEPTITADDRVKSWGAVYRKGLAGVAFMTGNMPSIQPKLKGNLSFELEGRTENWDPSEFIDIVIINKDMFGILINGQVYLMAKKLPSQQAIFRSENGCGYMLYYHGDSNSVWVSDSFTDHWSVFFMGLHQEIMQTGGKVGPDAVVSDAMLGFTPTKVYSIDHGRIVVQDSRGHIGILNVSDSGKITVDETYTIHDATPNFILSPDGSKLLWLTRSSGQRSQHNARPVFTLAPLSDFVSPNVNKAR